MDYGTTTQELQLLKPAGNDYYTINDANYNMDQIDSFAHSVNASLDGKAAKSAIFKKSIESSAWTGTGPYYATIQDSTNIDGNSLYVITSGATTKAERTEWIKCSIGLDYGSGHTNGVSGDTLYFVAFFKKPSSALNIVIEKR